MLWCNTLRFKPRVTHIITSTYFPHLTNPKTTTFLLSSYFIHLFSKPQTSQTFIQRSSYRTHITKHQRFRITTQGMLKKMRQFRITVGNMTIAIACQGTYNITQTRQTFINTLCFLQSLFCGTCNNKKKRNTSVLFNRG